LGFRENYSPKLIEHRLRDKDYPVLWFNPWEYERTNDVVLAFLQQIALHFKKDFGLKDLGIFTLSLFASGLDTAAQFFTGGSLSYDSVKTIFSDVDEAFQRRYESFVNIVEDIKKDFANLTEQICKNFENRPLVIFFDDLDRCLPENALDLLEALKNLFVVKNAKVIFVSGIDTSVAKRFITSKYEGISEDFALNYFKKIFNLTIDIPRLDKKRLEFFIKEYLNIALADDKDLHNNNIDIGSAVDKISQLTIDSRNRSLRSILEVTNQFLLFGQANHQHGLESDLVLSLLMLKEVWNDCFLTLGNEAIKSEHATLGQVLESPSFQKYGNDYFLSSYLKETLIEPYKDVKIQKILYTNLL